MPLWGNSDAVEDKPKHFTDCLLYTSDAADEP